MSDWPSDNTNSKGKYETDSFDNEHGAGLPFNSLWNSNVDGTAPYRDYRPRFRMHDLSGRTMMATAHAYVEMYVTAFDVSWRDVMEYGWMMAITGVMIAVVGLLCLTSSSHISNSIQWLKVIASVVSGRGDMDLDSFDGTGNKVESKWCHPQLSEQALLANSVLWWCGLLSLFLGVWASTLPFRHVSKEHYAFVALMAVFSCWCLWWAHGVQLAGLGGSIYDSDRCIHEMWLTLTSSTAGAKALVMVQEQLQCSGLTVCCATNTTPLVGYEGGDSFPPLTDTCWNSLCYISLPNGSMVNASKVDITVTVDEECGAAQTPATEVPELTIPRLDPCLRRLYGSTHSGFAAAITASLTVALLGFLVGCLTVANIRGAPPAVDGWASSLTSV